MREIKKIIFVVCLQLIICFQLYATKCEQVVTVKFYPYGGAKVYKVTGGNNDKRGVIDLGHFSHLEVIRKLNIGTVEVTVEMLETNDDATNTKYDIEFVNIQKLQNFMWTYNYEVTSFIGGNNDTTAKITVDNFKLGRMGSVDHDGTISFSCDGDHTAHAKYLNYRFDLILEIENLVDSTMYGFSPKKSSGNGAYINIKDIVLEQLNGSTTASAN